MGLWTPQVGETIKRRDDPDAPPHKVLAVRGSGISCTVLIDGYGDRWWDGAMFEPVGPVRQPASASPEAQLNEALADDSTGKGPVD
jgi:hypothetical protein